jgi:hypothetical protein
MANMPRLGQGLCRPRGVHPRNRHQATFANAAEFFNSLLGPPRRIYDPDARGMSVAEFVQNALRKSLIDAGFIDDEGQA